MEKALYTLRTNKFIRILYWPFANCLSWYRNRSYPQSKDSQYLKTLKDTHVGERCFIIGNGPSLTPEDLDKLKDEFSFGSNKIYYMFKKTQWRPTFYFAVDPDFLRGNADALIRLDLHNMFINIREKKRHWTCDPTFIYLKKKFSVDSYKYNQNEVSEDVSKFFTTKLTVTCTCLEMAMYMGFKEIYLLGVDHHYAKTIDENGVIHTDPTVKNYFEGMEGDQSIAIHPKEQATKGYQAIRDYADAHGIKIYNATRGGKLEVFERVEFDSLFGAEG